VQLYALEARLLDRKLFLANESSVWQRGLSQNLLDGCRLQKRFFPLKKRFC